MKTIRRILGTLLILLVLTILGYSATIAFNNPLTDKEKSMNTINFALQNIGIENPTWQTVVIAATQETDLPREAIWETWTKLEEWPTWSTPLHVSTRWLSDPTWQEGTEFEQVLKLGFPMGTITSTAKVNAMTPGEQVMWCKDEDGIKSCHVWQFEEISDGGTRVTNVEVFHGTAMGLVKPLIAKRVQGMFEASVDGLIQQAGQ